MADIQQTMYSNMLSNTHSKFSFFLIGVKSTYIYQSQHNNIYHNWNPYYKCFEPNAAHTRFCRYSEEPKAGLYQTKADLVHDKLL